MKRSHAWICLLLASLTSGCASPPATEWVRIPESLLTDCPVPEWTGGTYRDVAALAQRRQAALKNCNDQLRAARDYQDRLTGGKSAP